MRLLCRMSLNLNLSDGPYCLDSGHAFGAGVIQKGGPWVNQLVKISNYQVKENLRNPLNFICHTCLGRETKGSATQCKLEKRCLWALLELALTLRTNHRDEINSTNEFKPFKTASICLAFIFLQRNLSVFLINNLSKII